MRLASWNTHGLGNKSRGRMAGSFVTNFQIQFLAIQETMVKIVSQPILNEIWKQYAFEAIQVESDGRSGGLVSIWRSYFFSLINCWKCKHWIASVLRYIPSDNVVLIVNVYAPHLESSKRRVWEQLKNIACNWSGPICFLGDFNSVCTPDERCRESIDMNSIETFNDFILNASLIDQPLSNEEFTWEGPLGKMSRIDRVLLNSCWIDLWPDSILLAAKPDRSDHKPLVWGKKLVSWGTKLFRFNKAWFSKLGFLDMCFDNWANYPFNGWAAL
ncbi:uncharacterized protein [Rutidosis leptorrhynchoides]|uniref:uncharacterized protein n=1 Tax=Rutidosis leptorrhynchoides TaxID=125765 RepID=UPI003A98EABA